MGRKRIVEIEKEENRKIAELVSKVVGERSYKEAAIDAGIDPSTLSYICRGKVKPTPEVLVAITRPEANPQGGIILDELMIECGYQSDNIGRLMRYAEGMLQNVERSSQEEKANVISKARADYEKKNNTCRKILMQSVLDKGYSILSSKMKYLTNDDLARVDQAFEIANSGTKITNWMFCFDFTVIHADVDWSYAQLVFGHLMKFGKLDENTKISYVTLDKLGYDVLTRFKDKLPYKGELSVIYLDFAQEKIVEETYLTNYTDGDKSNEIYLV